MAWHFNPTSYGNDVNPYSVPAHDSREAAGSDSRRMGSTVGGQR